MLLTEQHITILERLFKKTFAKPPSIILRTKQLGCDDHIQIECLTISAEQIDVPKINGTYKATKFSLDRNVFVSNYPHGPDDGDVVDIVKDRSFCVIAEAAVAEYARLVANCELERIGDEEYAAEMAREEQMFAEEV